MQTHKRRNNSLDGQPRPNDYTPTSHAHPSIKSIAVVGNIAAMLWANLSVRCPAERALSRKLTSITSQALAPALIIFRAGRSWDHNNRNISHLSSLAFRPHTFTLSGAVGEVEAAPLDNDVEKNGPDVVPVIQDRIPGSTLNFTERSSNRKFSIFPHFSY